MSDSASWKADKGWGGDKDFLATDDWTEDDYSDLADDPILAAQLAEDEKLDRI